MNRLKKALEGERVRKLLQGAFEKAKRQEERATAGLHQCVCGSGEHGSHIYALSNGNVVEVCPFGRLT